jgi:hypothetical protein
MNSRQTETEMLDYLLNTRTGEDYEDTGSLIKLYLNIVENNNCGVNGDDLNDMGGYLDELPFYTINNFIETETTDEMEYNGHVEDLLEYSDYSTERRYFKYLQAHRGQLENILILSDNSSLFENAVSLWSVQDQLQTELHDWNDDLREEISDKINILITYWKEKRNRKRKQLINKLKIHSVEHLVLAYL